MKIIEEKHGGVRSCHSSTACADASAETLLQVLQINGKKCRKKDEEDIFKTQSETKGKIVECTINPFISFIEKQGLRGEGGFSRNQGRREDTKI